MNQQMESEDPYYDGKGKDNREVFKADKKFIRVKNVLYVAWAAGAVLLASCILVTNIKLFLAARNKRERYDDKSGKLEVYSLPGHNCLMGLFRPAIYVDTEELSDPELVSEVIKHEYSHYHAGDHVWQFFRTLCLILQWFNPLAWWAYHASRQDGELACDARVIKGYTDEEKFFYAKSLLRVLEGSRKNGKEILMVTSMGETKRRVKERIEAVMKEEKRKFHVSALILACFVGVICLVGFGRFGTAEKTLAEDRDPDKEPVASSEQATGSAAMDTGTGAEPHGKRIHRIDVKDYYITNIGRGCGRKLGLGKNSQGGAACIPMKTA